MMDCEKDADDEEEYIQEAAGTYRCRVEGISIRSPQDNN
jgi:hypothetical protein